MSWHSKHYLISHSLCSRILETERRTSGASSDEEPGARSDDANDWCTRLVITASWHEVKSENLLRWYEKTLHENPECNLGLEDYYQFGKALYEMTEAQRYAVHCRGQMKKLREYRRNVHRSKGSGINLTRFHGQGDNDARKLRTLYPSIHSCYIRTDIDFEAAQYGPGGTTVSTEDETRNDFVLISQMFDHRAPATCERAVQQQWTSCPSMV